MTYALIATNLAWAAAAAFFVRKAFAFHRETLAYYNGREDNFFGQQRHVLEHVRRLTNQIVLLKTNPQTAAVVAASDTELEEAYISPLDDEALAEYELERSGARQ